MLSGQTWPSPLGEVASSLTAGLFIPSQLVRGELEYLQQDVRWGNPEPSGSVHAAGSLQIRAGRGQPVSPACPRQPTGLPPPELPAHLECWALGRGTLGRVDGGRVAAGLEHRARFSPGLERPVAWVPQQGLIHPFLGADAYSSCAVLSNLRKGMEEEVCGL